MSQLVDPPRVASITSNAAAPPALGRPRAYKKCFRRGMPLVWLVSIAIAAACSGASTPSDGDCRAVRAHVIDLQLEAAGGDAARDQLAKHRRLRLAINQAGFIERCRATHTDHSIECALAAHSLDAYRACL